MVQREEAREEAVRKGRQVGLRLHAVCQQEEAEEARGACKRVRTRGSSAARAWTGRA